MKFPSFNNGLMIRAVLIFSICSFLYSPLSAQRVITLDDTLRGSITPERSWWDVTYYHLDISVLPDKQEIKGSVTIQYKVVAPGRTMQIDLQPPLQITKVSQGNKELEFNKKGRNAYFVSMAKEASVGLVDSVVVEYGGSPIIAKNPPWQGGFQFTKDQNGNPFIATSCQGLGASAWWPNKDHSSEEPDSMLMSVTVPKGLMDVSNGKLRSVDLHADSSRTFHWFVSNPINNYGVNVNIANYVHFADTLHGEKGVLQLDFFVLPENLEKAKVQFQQAKPMLRAFEYWFGPYPFYEDGYKLVETPYLGMEHQSSVTYGNGYQNGYRGTDLSGTGWGLKWDFIIIHESGHEWFANNITYKDIADMWIHESFTSYSETLFVDYHYGKEAGTDYVVGTRKNIKNDIPVIGVYNVNQRGSGDMYPKGANMLHTIRHVINNDELFRNILRGLNKTFYHQTVTSQQIENFISKESGHDFSKVFDQYLRTIKIPQLEYYVDKGKVFYRWQNVVDGFDMPLRTLSEGKTVELKPSTRWNKVKINGDAQSLLNATYLERMYFIKVAQVPKP